MIQVSKCLRKVLLLGMFTSSLCAQDIKPLTVGDKAPDVELGKIFNYPRKKASITDFKGKLLILDFWETGCLNCLKALPKMEQLQEKFKDKLQVVSVTKLSTREDILEKMKVFKVFDEYKMPTVIHDNRLWRYFPFEMVSHVVWIGPDGTIKAITGTENVTEENVQAILDGKMVNWPVKKDMIGFKYEQPLMGHTNNNIRTNSMYYSSLSSGIQGIDGVSTYFADSVNKTITVNMYNTELFPLCKAALDGSFADARPNPKEFVFEVKDINRYRMVKDYWNTIEERFCYSARFPLKNEKEIQKAIQLDLSNWLNTLFGIAVKKEKRMTKTLVLVRKPAESGELLQTKGGEEIANFNDERMQLVNVPVSRIVRYLNIAEKFPLYIIDETGISDTCIDLDMYFSSLGDISAVRRALQPYGLDIIEAMRPREVCVITERASSYDFSKR